MQRITPLLLLGLFVPTLSAQTTAVQETLPPGFASKAAGYYCKYLGGYALGREQFIYGDLQGSFKVLAVKGLKLRRSTYAQSQPVGRSWSNVQIQIGDADFQLMTDRYGGTTGNLKKPGLVFSGSVTFPGVSGFPSTTPGAWGTFAAADDMAFPFGTGGTTSSFTHLGKLGTAVDWTFQGGTMANGGSWLTQGYAVDGVLPTNNPTGNVWAGGTTYFGAGDTSCSWSGGTSYSSLRTWLFTDRLKDGSAQHRWQWYGYNYPPNAVCIGAISLSGNTTGVPFVSSCIKFHLGSILSTFPYKVDSTGTYVEEFFRAPLLTGSQGLKLWTQGAFTDPTTTKLELTTAFYSEIPYAPTNVQHFAARIYRNVIDSPYGYGPYDDQVPVIGLY